jgi:hypothetical protein
MEIKKAGSELPAHFGCAPGMARGAQAPFHGMWCPVDDFEVQVLYGP